MEAFSLDVDRGILALSFSEKMSNAPDEVDWASVSLRTHVNGLEGFGVTLWNTQGEPGWGDTFTTDDGLTLTVDIHPIDLDDLKAAHVGHNSSFTWLTLKAGAFVAQDGGEGNEPIYGTQVVGHNGASVSELVEDTTRLVPTQQSAGALKYFSGFCGYLDMALSLPKYVHTYRPKEPRILASKMALDRGAHSRA